MIDPTQLSKRNRALTRLACDTFRFETDSLARAMQKAGRRLPPKVHKQAAILIEAEQRAGHPKLAMMLDADQINRAAKAVETALKAIDPDDQRKGLILSTLGMMSFNLIVVFTALIVILLWRGFL